MKTLKGRDSMRAILHAKFGGHAAGHSLTSERAPRMSPSPQLRDSVEDFEAALTKARAAWRASRGPTRTATGRPRMVRRP